MGHSALKLRYADAMTLGKTQQVKCDFNIEQVHFARF